MAQISINTTNVFLNGFSIGTDILLNNNNYYLTCTENGINRITDKLYTINNVNNATSLINSWTNLGFTPNINSNICFQLNDTSSDCPSLICKLGVA